MIARIWKGTTTLENAAPYEHFLKEEFLPAVEAKKIPGYRKFQLLRQDGEEEVHFVTIMWFDSLEQIKEFAGDDYKESVVHPKARALLKHYEFYSRHLELIHELNYS